MLNLVTHHRVFFAGFPGLYRLYARIDAEVPSRFQKSDPLSRTSNVFSTGRYGLAGDPAGLSALLFSLREYWRGRRVF
jgi:hypothetical protein